MEHEYWKVIKDFPKYQVSTFGKIRHIESLKIKKYINSSGYRNHLTVSLQDGVKCRVVKVGKIVAQTFIGPCPENHHLVNLDHDEKNVCLNNLAYVTNEDFNDRYRKEYTIAYKKLRQPYGMKVGTPCNTRYKSTNDFVQSVNRNYQFSIEKALREVMEL